MVQVKNRYKFTCKQIESGILGFRENLFTFEKKDTEILRNMKQRKLRKIEDENWRAVPDSNNRYHVSNYGRIKSFAYNKKEGQILKASEINGFKQVQLNIKKIQHKFYVHKLVAQIWISRPSDKHIFVTHLDGILKNNHISNLEWHTKETLVEKHREYAKLRPRTSNGQRVVRNSKLTESDIMLLKSMLERGVVQAKIAKLFCISEMQVTRIKRGENWGHIKPSTTGKEKKVQPLTASIIKRVEISKMKLKP